MPRTHLRLAPFLQRITQVNPHFDRERVEAAYEYARELYEGDEHWAGMPTLEHVTGVVEILAPFEPDEDAIIACLLHHVILAGGSLRDIEERFGPTVRTMVSGIHMLTAVTLEGRRQSIEDLRLMLLSVSDDVRIILVSLCDRCHVLKHLDVVEKSEAQRIASDVLNLFAPVAARLGIYALKHELERRAFPICYPSDAERIEEQQQFLKKRTGDFLPLVAEDLQVRLAKHGFRAEVEQREKQAFSTFRKMRSKSYSHIEDVFDLFAIRVIVDSVEECYRVLGLLHQIGHPLAHRFKDFIAFPKPNGYQSLHTALAKLPHSPSDTCIEVQVRTRKMHREAQYGIAAHWSYKEYGSTARAMEQVQLKKMLSDQEMIATHEPSLADHIFVLTPKGDIIELPEGATPLDFAFQVHTDVGLSYKAALVNGSIVAMDHELENGDVIEIHRHAVPQPVASWMQMLKMPSSRAKLKRYLYSQRRTEFVARGRDLVNSELERLHLPPLDRELSILRLFESEALPFARREDILMKVGQGTEKILSLFEHLDALKGKIPERKKVTRPSTGAPKPTIKEIRFEDGVPMPHRIAKCCKPSADTTKEIIGLVNRQGKVMIHAANCRMIKRCNKERMVDVSF